MALWLLPPSKIWEHLHLNSTSCRHTERHVPPIAPNQVSVSSCVTGLLWPQAVTHLHLYELCVHCLCTVRVFTHLWHERRVCMSECVRVCPRQTSTQGVNTCKYPLLSICSANSSHTLLTSRNHLATFPLISLWSWFYLWISGKQTVQTASMCVVMIAT